MNAACELPNQHGPLNIPLHVRKELLKYLQDHVEPGPFLWAVIHNDLKRTVRHATGEELHCLPDLLQYLQASVSSVAWGSRPIVKWWLENKPPRQRSIFDDHSSNRLVPARRGERGAEAKKRNKRTKSIIKCARTVLREAVQSCHITEEEAQYLSIELGKVQYSALKPEPEDQQRD